MNSIPKNNALQRGLACVFFLLDLLSATAEDPFLRGDYPTSTKYLSDFTAAVESANGVLKAEGVYRLIHVDNSNKALSTNDIPVRLVRFTEADKGRVALVPPYNRIILVDAADLARIEKVFSNPYRRNSVPKRKYLLSLFLLHELGHIVHKDFCRDPPPSRRTEYKLDPAYTNYVKLLPTDLNLDETRFKEMEDSADLFAAEQIHNAKLLTNRFECWSPAYSLALTVNTICWNAQAQRLHTHFGSYALASPEVFADKDLTHPNLDLRFLRMNYYITRQSESKQLLDYFLEARSKVQFVPRTVYVDTNKLAELVSQNTNNTKNPKPPFRITSPKDTNR